MGKALYRKYRSRKFSEVVGQEHITTTLSNAINNGQISHAYLFTGPRGVGKTSVARILAHEVNSLKYDSERLPLDIIEIDAASNRRIDEIRDLRDKVHIAPTSAKYKVYIIDEVHMLTREAFNALLKTLEEPPSHCIFILATTEAHKLPATIISRTQRFAFRPIENKHSVDHLKKIAQKEKIDIDNAALELIADYGEGSFRDSIGLLDQLSGSGKPITDEVVREVLGFPPHETLVKIIGGIEKGSISEVEAYLWNLWGQGSNPSLVSQQLSQMIRRKAVATPKQWMFDLLKQLIEIPASSSPLESLDICLLEAATKNQADKKTKRAAAVANDGASVYQPAPDHTHRQSEHIAKLNVDNPTNDQNFDLKYWPKVVSKSKSRSASLYSALKLARPAITEGGELILAFEYPFHQKKVSQASNLKHLSDIVTQLGGSRAKIKCAVDKSQFKTKVTSAPKAHDGESINSVQAINNIFGNAEMIEL